MKCTSWNTNVKLVFVPNWCVLPARVPAQLGLTFRALFRLQVKNDMLKRSNYTANVIRLQPFVPGFVSIPAKTNAAGQVSTHPYPFVVLNDSW